jgi:hypothetical protein
MIDDNPGGSPARQDVNIMEMLEFSLTNVDIHKTAHSTCQTASVV